MGFRFAKAVWFYWLTDAFLYLHRWPSLFVKKKKAAQRNVHARLSFNHLKNDNIKVGNMLFLNSAGFQVLDLKRCFVGVTRGSFSFGEPILLHTGALIVLYQRKANSVDVSPARPRVCIPSRVCTACSALFCAQMNETRQARAEQHKRTRFQRQKHPAAERNSKIAKAQVVLTCNNIFF